MSINTKVANISKKTIKGISACTANVTTVDGNKTATIKVTVLANNTKTNTGTNTNTKTDTTVAVAGVSLNKVSLSLTEGESATITATVAPSNATNKTVTWKSSNTGVATVSNGVVKAIKAGTATITVTTSNGKTASITVKVNEKAKPVVYEYKYVLTTYKRQYLTDWVKSETELKEKDGLEVKTCPETKDIDVLTAVKVTTRTGRSSYKPKDTENVKYNIIKYSDGVYTWEEVTTTNIYTTVTNTTVYYCSRTYTTVVDNTLVEWSTSTNDTKLLNQGYKLTTEKREKK